MQQYPTINGSSKAPLGKPCLAFYKYDGSNLRWEWSPKQIWYKFGTRTQLFDESDPIYNKAIPIFLNTMGDEIVRRVKDLERGIQRITVFTEFFGPNSFAGQHVDSDIMELRLIDVFLYKKGFMKPRSFIKTFGDLPYAAELIYDGMLNKEFINDVRIGKYPVWEGVVAKGEDFMVKIKTNEYFKKLNEVYGTQYRIYWE
jgi:hypothetical protein